MTVQETSRITGVGRDNARAYLKEHPEVSSVPEKINSEEKTTKTELAYNKYGDVVSAPANINSNSQQGMMFQYPYAMPMMPTREDGLTPWVRIGL